jgi:flagellar assembly protein FliH
MQSFRQSKISAMASKIIKQGTVRAMEVQQFLFTDNGVEALTPQPVHWPELQDLPVQQQRNILPVELEKSEVDIELIEKNAFEKGFRQGEQSGLTTAEEKIDVLIKHHAESILEMGRIKSVLYSQVEREVAKLAIEVAKKIVHREIQVDQDIIQTLVHVALAHVAEKTPVTIHVNPVDYNYISERQTELSHAEGRSITLVADKSIERGGCFIDTDCGDIDARLEEKFHEVEHAFFEGVSQHP